MLQKLRDQECKHRLLHPAKLSITTDGENRIFHDKTKFNLYLSTNPALQKVLEGKFQPNEVSYTQKTQATSNLTPHTSKPQRRETHEHYHRKMKGINNHWPLTSLNINGLNPPIK